MVQDHMIRTRQAKLIFDNYNPKYNIFVLSTYKFMQLFSLKIKVAVYQGKIGFPLKTTAPLNQFHTQKARITTNRV